MKKNQPFESNGASILFSFTLLFAIVSAADARAQSWMQEVFPNSQALCQFDENGVALIQATIPVDQIAVAVTAKDKNCTLYALPPNAETYNLSALTYPLATGGKPHTTSLPMGGDKYKYAIVSSEGRYAHPVTVRFDAWPIRGPTGNSFDPDFKGPDITGGALEDLVVQPDGKIVITGTFKQVNGITRLGIARLNQDGSLDLRFNAGEGIVKSDLGTFLSTPTVLALDAQTNILVGGNIKIVGGESRVGIARLKPNGALDERFDPGSGVTTTFTPFGASEPREIPGLVSKIIVQPDGNILICGAFTRVGGNRAYGVARLKPDGTLDETFDAGSGTLFDRASAMALLDDGSVVVGGAFTTFNGAPVENIARLDSTGYLDMSFMPPNIGGIETIEKDGFGNLLLTSLSVAPTSDGMSPSIYRFNTYGKLDSTPGPPGAIGTPISFSQVVRLLPYDGNKVLAGGSFVACGGSAKCAGLVAFDSDGNPDPSIDIGSGFLVGNVTGSTSDSFTQGRIDAIAAQGDKFIVAGDYTLAAGRPMSRIVRLRKVAPSTVPADTCPPIRITKGNSPESFDLSWSGVLGRTYAVYASKDGLSWEIVVAPIQGADGQMTFHGRMVPQLFPYMFYRLAQ